MSFKTSLILTVTFCLLYPPTIQAQYTPDSIYTAARAGKIDDVLKKLDEGIVLSALNNALGAAVAGNQPEIVQLLIDRGADINHMSSFESPIINNAIMYGSFEAAKVLVEAGADLTILGFNSHRNKMVVKWQWTPLMCATRVGHNELVELMLNHGADPNQKGWSTSYDELETAADIAAYSGQLDLLKLLIDAGSKVDPETIFKTVRGGHIETFKYLVKQDKDLDRFGRFGKTLLMEASWWGQKDITKYLLKKRVDVNLVGKNGNTALLETVSNPDARYNKPLRQNQLSITKMLLNKNASLGYVSPNGYTALSLSMQNDLKDTSEFLLKQVKKSQRK